MMSHVYTFDISASPNIQNRNNSAYIINYFCYKCFFIYNNIGRCKNVILQNYSVNNFISFAIFGLHINFLFETFQNYRFRKENYCNKCTKCTLFIDS